ncbi:MAG: metal-sensitive transcriptional regulator [Bacteroidetes bacterium]|nr:MAG: metal-sensitive transcriptional regulator [Bacteroidota bacterium]
MHLDDQQRDAVLKRLRRIEGQIRGLQRMVEEDRYCGDVLNQISSVQQALRSVGKVITRTHLETCVTDALRSGDPEAARRTYDEIMDLLYKQLK